MAHLSPLATKRLIRTLFGSQLAAARALRFSDRQVRYWCAYGAPPHVVKILQRMRSENLSIRSARWYLRNRRERRLAVPDYRRDSRDTGRVTSM